eukprot:1567141-Pyramimonas_sp.AAC.1
MVRIGKSPLWHVNYSDPPLVTDRVLKLRWVSVHGTCFMCNAELLSRALRALYCPQWESRHVGLEITLALNGGPWDSEVDAGLCAWNLSWATQNTSLARARSSVLSTVGKSQCWSGD